MGKAKSVCVYVGNGDVWKVMEFACDGVAVEDLA